MKPEVEKQPSASVKAGLAIGTLPEAGQELGRGRTITLLVSTGAKRVEVPFVIGEQEDVADSEISDAGLIPNFENRDSDEPAGQVPIGGSSAPQASPMI